MGTAVRRQHPQAGASAASGARHPEGRTARFPALAGDAPTKERHAGRSTEVTRLATPARGRRIETRTPIKGWNTGASRLVGWVWVSLLDPTHGAGPIKRMKETHRKLNLVKE
jgi:hypothetical protein